MKNQKSSAKKVSSAKLSPAQKAANTKKAKRIEAAKEIIDLKSENLKLKNELSVFLKPVPATPFEKCVENRLEETRRLILVKGKEYVRGNDRFHNFNRAAKMNNQTPTRSLHGMLTKHLVSMLDILDDIDSGKIPTKETVDEKFGDIVVYVILQEALIKEKVLTIF